MKRIVVLALAGWLAVACSPVVAPVQVARPAALEAAPAWSAEQAEAGLRAALQRRDYAPDVVDGTIVPLRFDASMTWQRPDGGQVETLAGPGAWLFATTDGQFWVFESGIVLPAAG